MSGWLKRLGEELVARRGQRKQDDFANTIGISRQQLSIMENGGRGYGIEPLLLVLAGLEPEKKPVHSLMEIASKLDATDAKAAEALGQMVGILSGDDPSHRDMAILLVKGLRKNQVASRSLGTNKKRTT